jgi:hypothetical protein
MSVASRVHNVNIILVIPPPDPDIKIVISERNRTLEFKLEQPAKFITARKFKTDERKPGVRSHLTIMKMICLEYSALHPA